MKVNGSRTAVLGVVLALAAALIAALVGGASAAAPCATGGPTNALTRVSADGKAMYGSSCSDRIVVTSPVVEEVFAGGGDDIINVNSGVELVDSGAGDDIVYGELPHLTTAALASAERRLRRAGRPALATASVDCSIKTKEGKSCYGGDGSQELVGGTGKDKIFGQRGNDTIYGESGDDSLYGGVGDDFVYGNQDNDLVTGGLGTETVDGNNGNDLVRGDGTIDIIKDTGGSGTDTLSFATSVTPGFHGAVGPAGFPSDSNGEERGVDIHLDGSTCEGEFEACNNDARYGGGLDNIDFFSFENVIGSPFADVIVGSSGANRIDGGGGADVIYGKGGNDVIYGGPDGDFISGDAESDTVNGQGGTDNCIAETVEDCAGTAENVTQRDRTKISAGFMATNLPETSLWSEVYLTGSTGVDQIKVAYSLEVGTGYVTFTREGESASFDVSGDAASAGCTYEAAKVKCTLPKPLDAITVAGMDGNDVLTLEGFPETSMPVLLGGEDDDQLTISNGTEDMLVDGNGSGNDILRAGSYDDALINNEGKDTLEGGLGNDLLLSAANCEEDTLDGAKSTEDDGGDVNSASWAKMPTGSVAADLEKGKAGNEYSGGPTCSSGAGKVGTLLRIDDLEGSSGADILYGDGKGNNLLGRPGKDEIYGRAGVDRIEAKDEIAEVGGGGEGSDSCVLDAGDKFNSCNP